jgi:ERCC4-type nuclease
VITIDNREGSKELIPVLSKMGLPVRSDYIAYGDVMFLGQGPDGPLLIGIEYKKLSDLLQSWFDNRLLGHQLPGMQNAYDINYLLIEGIYSCDEEGLIRVLRERGWRKHESEVRYENLRGWLSTLQTCYGVRTLEVPNLLSAAVQVAALYRWWQKEFSHHGSSMYVHLPNLQKKLLIPTPVQRVASTFPGVGIEKLIDIGDKFASIRAMVNANAEEWMGIDGIGKTRAEKIVGYLS